MKRVDKFLIWAEDDDYRLWYDMYDNLLVWEQKDYTSKSRYIWKKIDKSRVPKDVELYLTKQIQKKLKKKEDTYLKDDKLEIMNHKGFRPLLNKEEYLLLEGNSKNDWYNWGKIFDEVHNQIKDKVIVYTLLSSPYKIPQIGWLGKKFDEFSKKIDMVIKPKYLEDLEANFFSYDVISNFVPGFWDSSTRIIREKLTRTMIPTIAALNLESEYENPRNLDFKNLILKIKNLFLMRENYQKDLVDFEDKINFLQRRKDWFLSKIKEYEEKPEDDNTTLIKDKEDRELYEEMRLRIPVLDDQIREAQSYIAHIKKERGLEPKRAQLLESEVMKYLSKLPKKLQLEIRSKLHNFGKTFHRRVAWQNHNMKKYWAHLPKRYFKDDYKHDSKSNQEDSETELLSSSSKVYSASFSDSLSD